ncbi:hypothetical protein TELCIR_04031 [Teladorsagia circumcincta]|uniref:Uncharacterized protein n=1 Tax=Teladorsagia circumcincta TaxID=45464 RepID=A0A2G9UWT7_TELCI|nr:hypothetical protein TELCIR_04031 [Teladorsagia circumcincta]
MLGYTKKLYSLKNKTIGDEGDKFTVNNTTFESLRMNMMFPGGVGSSELQQAAAEKVKRDIGTFVIFGFLIEAVAFGASYLNIEGFLI